MSDFFFSGKISSSKSIMNRGLICSSFGENFQLIGDSQCDDVVKMREAVARIGIANSFDCGSAGTVLRFLAFRISRLEGSYRLMGTERLFSRPQEELLALLKILGVTAMISEDHLIISGEGWKPLDGVLSIDRSISSQFITGVTLSAWGLDFPLGQTTQNSENRKEIGALFEIPIDTL